MFSKLDRRKNIAIRTNVKKNERNTFCRVGTIEDLRDQSGSFKDHDILNLLVYLKDQTGEFQSEFYYPEPAGIEWKGTDPHGNYCHGRRDFGSAFW